MTKNPAVLDSSVLSLDLLLKGTFDITMVGGYLDGLEPAARVAQVRALTRPAQAALYEAAKGARKLTLDQLVPASVPDLIDVVHEGKSSLPAFNQFARVFCRPKRDAKLVWGYNRASKLVIKVVGPGYCTAYEGPGDELLIDYTRLPEGKPESWPEIIPNRARLGRFVYANMIDALRAVSHHVTVGRSIRNNQVLDSWFVLCGEGCGYSPARATAALASQSSSATSPK